MSNTDSAGCLIGIDMENQNNVCKNIDNCLGITGVSCGWCKSSNKAMPHGTIINHKSIPCTAVGECNQEDWITFHYNCPEFINKSIIHTTKDVEDTNLTEIIGNPNLIHGCFGLNGIDDCSGVYPFPDNWNSVPIDNNW